MRHERRQPKSKIVRPYAPDYVDATTLAYRLCVSESSIEKWEREGKLPPRHDVFGVRRWKWEYAANLFTKGSPSSKDQLSYQKRFFL